MGILKHFFFRCGRGIPLPFLSGARPECVRRQRSAVATASILLVLALAGNALAAGAAKEGGAQDTATIELKGLLIPLHQANLSSRSTGVIRAMKEEGDEVRKDDIVVSMDDDNEKLAVESGKAVLEVRQSEYDTSKGLSKMGSDSKQNTLTALANLKTADASYKQAQVALEKKSVHAPFDGVVTKRMRQPGEATDNYLPLLTMVDLSKLYLETYLPANRLRDVQPGQAVEVSVPDLPGKKFTGSIDFIAPVIDPASGEFRVKIVLDNSSQALRSGMGAVGLLPLSGHPADPHTGAVTPPPGSSPARPH